jgi:ankyrin repeat protein
MEPSPRFNPDAADVQERSTATLEMLLAKGADVNARITDVKSRTARWGRGNTLPERGGQSALFGAVQYAWPKVVQYLIAHGAKVDVKDDLGVSPLDAATGKAKTEDNRPSDAVAKLLQASIGK